MKNTRCENCLFSDKASSDHPCEHMIIEHIRDRKKLSIENDFYIIENYTCKMGFSRQSLENNKDKYSIEDIKSQILQNACIKYYLLMDITSLDNKELSKVCQKIKELQIPPKYISFLILNNSKGNSKGKIKTIEESKIQNTEWKSHGFIVQMNKMEAIHLALDTNLKKNNSQLLLFYSPRDIDSLDEDINEINTIVNIDQPNFHVLFKKGKEDSLDGLLMSFDSYSYAKGEDPNILKAISNLEGTIKLSYGTK